MLLHFSQIAPWVYTLVLFIRFLFLFFVVFLLCLISYGSLLVDVHVCVCDCHTKLQQFYVSKSVLHRIINPRRACARVTVLVLSVCLSVCVSVCVCFFPILAPRAIRRTNSSISDFSTIRA